MSLFKVLEIVDANTIKVDDWQANGKEGNLVRVLGYDTSTEKIDDSFFKNNLTKLLLGKEVKLVGAKEITEESGQWTVHCRVYLNDIDISTYFILV